MKTGTRYKLQGTGGNAVRPQAPDETTKHSRAMRSLF